MVYYFLITILGAMMKTAFPALVLLAMLSGCASTGVDVKPEQLSSFQQGVTTESDVIQSLGSPNSSSMSSDGTKILAYSFAQYKTRGATFIPIVGLFAGGTDMRMTSTIFTFDKDGKLLSYNATESNYGTGTGFSPPMQQTNQPR